MTGVKTRLWAGKKRRHLTGSNPSFFRLRQVFSQESTLSKIPGKRPFHMGFCSFPMESTPDKLQCFS